MSSTITEVLRDPGLQIDLKCMMLANYPGPEPASSRTQQGLPLPPFISVVPTILDKDKNTPDGHVRRDGRLIRLTDVHPFNTEAPLTLLYNDGMGPNALGN